MDMVLDSSDMVLVLTETEDGGGGVLASTEAIGILIIIC